MPIECIQPVFNAKRMPFVVSLFIIQLRLARTRYVSYIVDKIVYENAMRVAKWQ